MLSIRSLLIPILLAFAGTLSVLADESVEIIEWQVPWEKTRPRDPYVDQQGRVWFCGQTGQYIAYFDPNTEEFKKYDLEEGAAPHNLIVDKEGFVWFAGNIGGYIGKLDPETGNIRKFPMPDPEVKDPHTLVFDSKGDIWFTAQFSNIVGKLKVETGEIILIPIPTEGARPYGIKVDSRDRPWIVLFGTNKLATVDPETFKLREYELPRKEIRPRRLAITSYDKIWIVDYASGRLGRFDPVADSYIERRIPGGNSAKPYAMTVDDKDRLWFVETGVNPNRLVGFDPGAKEFFHIVEIPSGGGTVRHMYYHPATREIWFGTDTNFIGRAFVPE
ncbi:MAG: lyase [Gammaproteobacteria bacterium]|nr:lyase [Gammaproteobacteria bacterium]